MASNDDELRSHCNCYDRHISTMARINNSKQHYTELKSIGYSPVTVAFCWSLHSMAKSPNFRSSNTSIDQSQGTAGNTLE